MNINTIFNIHKINTFNEIALEIFAFQAVNCSVYNKFLSLLNVDIHKVKTINQIPFLPIQFFKSHKIISSKNEIQETFLSSGTTGNTQSKHYVTDVSVYGKSFTNGFEYFYGAIEDFTVLALLPSYLERNGSSLIYMTNHFIKKSNKPQSGFYLNNLDELSENLIELDENNEKVLLIGVSFALLDLVETYNFKLRNTIIMETGGMKGKRKELIREELHQVLKEGFGVDTIHSEIGRAHV